MEITMVPPDKRLLTDRSFVISMVIKSFKGRKNVEVHLFRAEYDPEELEAYDWNLLLGDELHPYLETHPDLSRKVLLEAFTEDESKQVLEYLKERYQDRVSSVTCCVMDLPIPLGLPPLSEIPEGKTTGFIRMNQIPNYTLPFAVHGFYDLSQHDPLVQDD